MQDYAARCIMMGRVDACARRFERIYVCSDMGSEKVTVELYHVCVISSIAHSMVLQIF
jgi:hypothetical protein